MKSYLMIIGLLVSCGLFFSCTDDKEEIPDTNIFNVAINISPLKAVEYNGANSEEVMLPIDKLPTDMGRRVTWEAGDEVLVVIGLFKDYDSIENYRVKTYAVAQIDSKTGMLVWKLDADRQIVTADTLVKDVPFNWELHTFKLDDKLITDDGKLIVPKEMGAYYTFVSFVPGEIDLNESSTTQEYVRRPHWDIATYGNWSYMSYPRIPISEGIKIDANYWQMSCMCLHFKLPDKTSSITIRCPELCPVGYFGMSSSGPYKPLGNNSIYVMTWYDDVFVYASRGSSNLTSSDLEIKLYKNGYQSYQGKVLEHYELENGNSYVFDLTNIGLE